MSSVILDMKTMLSGEVSVIEINTSFIPEGYEFSQDIFFPEPIMLTGKIENKAGYMRALVEITAVYETVCARCLKGLKERLSVPLDKTVAVSGTLEDENSDEIENEYLLIKDGKLDLGEAAAEQLLLEFPYRHLCSETCRGLCPKCGKDLNAGDCACPKKEIDPRLEVLKSLLENR